ncbi:MAG: hypothetical protein K9L98_01995 [Candidatus Pacebacteria bacterium]|nr:hypothetical protein [Candidatus Paceibacterota bacterium]MCF7862759.1 hypothetical protein [Candidatus Paceibacterota bacterium]
MQKDLESEILDLVQNIKKQGKHHLAECIQKNWDKKAIDYSKDLNDWHTDIPIEKELKEAFEKELVRTGKSVLKDATLKSLVQRRVLQTAPHLGVTYSPRMSCVEWLGSLAVPENEYYISAVFSGVPFSNSSRPGRINRKENSVNLFHSNLQDAIVYRSTIPEKLLDMIKTLPENLKNVLEKAELGASYTKWAMNSCENIERKIFKKENIVLLDINEITAEYLKNILNKEDHPIHKILFDKNTRDQFTSIFPEEIMFYVKTTKGKYEVMENAYLKEDSLVSKNFSLSLDSEKKEDLIQAITDGKLCPALILVFITVAFINGFKCFGSFIQVEYLSEYKEKLAQLEIFKKYDILNIPTANLTTGIIPEMNEYPADLISFEKDFSPNSEILFGEVIMGIKDILIKND